MPVDLADYPLRLRKALKRGGYACVYVATIDGSACRVGYANDLFNAIARMRRAVKATVLVEDVCWCPDRSIATQVAGDVRDTLGEHAMPGGWFNLVPIDAISELKNVARCRFPLQAIVFHDTFMAGRKS